MAYSATWTGSLSLAMMTIPVKLYVTASGKGFSFSQLHKDCGGNVNYVKMCRHHEPQVELETSDLARGYKLPSGEYLVIEDSDLETLPLSTRKAIDLDGFVPESEIDPLYFERSYYVRPDGDGGTKPYTLLVQAMKARGVVAVAKITMSQKENLCVLRVSGDQLVLSLMYYADEVRPNDVPQMVTSAAEQNMALQLVDALSTDWEPGRYHDEYQAALGEVITAKQAGSALPVQEAAAPQGSAMDLMAQLQASLASVRGSQPVVAPVKEEEQEVAF